MVPRAPVTFQPSGSTVWVEVGSTLLDAARLAGVAMEATCGGHGRCGTCAVRVIEGTLSAPDAVESGVLARAASGVRLACRATVEGAVRVAPIARTTLSSATASDRPIGDDAQLVAAVDLGTSTVAAAVVDGRSGIELGHSVVPNRQRVFGGDVLSRLAAAVAGDGEALRRLSRESVKEALVSAAGVNAHRIERVVLAGNTAMSALFTGADVSELAVHPFAVPPDCCRTRHEDLADVGLAPSAQLVVLEPIAGFVGGDALAGALALSLTQGHRANLLVDVGTNAEVVLGLDGSVWATSAAAGPAFEGVGIASARIAGPGAVVRVEIGEAGDVELQTVDGDPPEYFAGSGLLSALALLVRTGHVDPDGLVHEQGPLADRITRDDTGVRRVEFGGATSLALTQLDIRALQLAKAAVRVAIDAVLDASSVSDDDLETVHVSGAFGAALEPQDLVELGLVPQSLGDRLRPAGNTSLAGALALAIAPEGSESERAVLVAARHVQLAGDPGFQDALLAALSLEPYSR